MNVSVMLRTLWPKQQRQRHDLGDEPELIAKGWDKYAEQWKAEEFRVLPGFAVEKLGDEWTGESGGRGATTYGLPEETLRHFAKLLCSEVLDPHLPDLCERGLEIGPGGGRITALLLPRTKELHLVEPSLAMIRHHKERFPGAGKLVYHNTDGMSIPSLGENSFDYVIAFDVFVHFEPRLVYWYLKQIVPLLRPGGVGIIHYSNVLTPIGWQQFMFDLKGNLRGRTHFASFGVMCPALMTRFLDSLSVETVTVDLGTIPRDAIAVFRKPFQTAGG